MAFHFFKQKKDGTLIEYFMDYSNIKKTLTEYYLEIGAKKIASTLARLPFFVDSKNENEKASTEYLLNISPNANQTSTELWQKAIEKMILDPDGALIVNTKKNGYFLAESFTASDDILKEKTYSNVTISVDESNSLNLNKTFKASDVLHLKYSNTKLRALQKAVNEQVASAYAVAVNGFKAKAPKVTVNVDAGFQMVDAAGNVVSTNAYANDIAQKLSSEEVKAILLMDGINISQVKSESSLSADDVEKLRLIVMKNVAYALDIPLKTMMNEFDKDSDTEFITHTCLPVVSTIEDCINFAWVGQTDYMKGTNVIMDIRNTRHVAIIDNANNLDKLFMNGFTFDYLMQSMGYPQIDEEWAKTPRFTKNYATEEQLRSEYLTSEGGE